MCNGNCNQGRSCDCGIGPARGIFNGLLISAVFWASVAVVIFLSGCTVINVHQEPPKDWPKLEVTVKKVGFWELQKICGGSYAIGLLTQYFGCAWIYFDTMKCDVYYAADDESAKGVIEHEEKHCEGYDHIGSTALRDAWEEWKKQNRSAAK